MGIAYPAWLLAINGITKRQSPFSSLCSQSVNPPSFSFDAKENEAKENFSPRYSSCISDLLTILTKMRLMPVTRVKAPQTRRARLRNASRNKTELSLMGARGSSRGLPP